MGRVFNQTHQADRRCHERHENSSELGSGGSVPFPFEDFSSIAV